MKKVTIPGVVKAVTNYRGWVSKKSEKKTIEEKREVVIKGIERSLRKEKRAPALEQFDREHKAPVIRVLYASKPLPVFDGAFFAVIEPACDRKKLWDSIISEIRAGSFDAQIEDAAGKIYQSIGRKKAVPLKTA